MHWVLWVLLMASPRLSPGQRSHQHQYSPGICESDLQYLVHAPFLGHLSSAAAPALVDSTARLFTTALLSHLSVLKKKKKKLTLKFSIPEINAWSAIRPAYHNTLGQPNRQPSDFTVGALHASANLDEPPVRKLFCQTFLPRGCVSALPCLCGCVGWRQLCGKGRRLLLHG